MSKLLQSLLCCLGLAGLPAQAAVITLNFEGIVPAYPFNSGIRVLDYYDGGASGAGTVGPAFGVAFTGSAAVICLNTEGIECSNSSRGEEADPLSRQAAMYFLSGQGTFLNVAAGFDGGFALSYAAVFQSAYLTVYSGLNGTGTALGTLALPVTPSTCLTLGQYCPFLDTGMRFAGVGRSVLFGGAANQVVFDDLRLGVAADTPVPAPPGVLLFGIGMLGLAATRPRRRRPAQMHSHAFLKSCMLAHRFQFEDEPSPCIPTTCSGRRQASRVRGVRSAMGTAAR